jgi:diguanylate cyclase (GGDEF)-like protein
MILRVLIVDDDSSALRLLQHHLTSGGYEVVTATNGREAMEVLHREGPQIVITDWMMPEMDGLALCRAIRESECTGFVYVIMVTAHRDKAQTIEALEAGADEFLCKPVHREELLARLKAGTRILQLEEVLAQQHRKVHKTNAELAVLNERLERLATTDELTGLANRREAMRRLHELWALSVRNSEPLSCFLLDIDHFKRCNDAYGHDAGDAVLRSTAHLLKGSARAGELVSRVGGEEFLVLCPGSTARMAALGGDRLRRAVESHQIPCAGRSITVTISVGAAERDSTTSTPEELLRRADEAMYSAKKNGRNRVCIGGEHVSQRAPAPSAVLPAAPDPARAALGSPANRPVQVLVVDDDPTVHTLCRRLLERDGYHMRTASDGVEALAACQAELPDVIIMDGMMPNMDGLECTQRLKADPVTARIPIIMASARTSQTDVIAGLKAGVDEYLTKPFDPRELQLRVRAAARLSLAQLDLSQMNEVRGEQARALQILFDFSRELVSATSLETILDATIAAAAELTFCRRVSVMFPDEDGNNLVIVRSMGIDEAVAQRVRLPRESPIAGTVFGSGRPVVVNSPDEIRQLQPQYDTAFFASLPLVCVGLGAAGDVVGVLNVTERYQGRPFEALELEYLTVIGNMCATTVKQRQARNARDQAHLAIVTSLASLAEQRDGYTGAHIQRVARFGRILAEDLRAHGCFAAQIDEAFVSDLQLAALVHDIGKVVIPDAIFGKPGKLTQEEMAIMQTHAEFGAQAIRSIREDVPQAPFLQMAEEIAWGHHERFDGAGYPRGLKGDAIPLAARIISVADVFDAMTTDRPYKKARSRDAAVAEIRRESGAQFDPLVVEALLRQVNEFARTALELSDPRQPDVQAAAPQRSARKRIQPVESR